jgi:hypothetical protein
MDSQRFTFSKQQLPSLCLDADMIAICHSSSNNRIRSRFLESHLAWEFIAEVSADMARFKRDISRKSETSELDPRPNQATSVLTLAWIHCVADL